MSNMTPRRKARLFQKIVLSSLIIIIFLAGCSVIGFFDEFLPNGNVAAEHPVLVDSSGSDEVLPTQSPTEEPVQYGVISAWVPPQFDPSLNSESAQILNNYLQTFQKINPDVEIEFRVRAEQGSNSILETLSITASAASDALPTIVLLSRLDMVEAANRGLIRPIEFYTSTLEGDDWFPFAYEMGVYHNENFGLPFATDVIVMATNRTNLSDSYQPLSLMNKKLGRTGYAAGDSDSLIPFIFYESSGGRLVNDQDHPTLTVEPVASLLSVLESSRRAGTLSAELYDFQSDEDVWGEFISGNFDTVFTWARNVSLSSEDYAIKHIPGIGGDPFTYSEGWVWCLVQKSSTDTDINITFMEYMVSPDILDEWTAMAGFMPVRPSSVISFGENQDLISQILSSTQLLPDLEVRSYANEALAGAINEIFQGVNTVEGSTQNLFDQLEGNDTP